MNQKEHGFLQNLKLSFSRSEIAIQSFIFTLFFENIQLFLFNPKAFFTLFNPESKLGNFISSHGKPANLISGLCIISTISSPFTDTNSTQRPSLPCTHYASHPQGVINSHSHFGKIKGIETSSHQLPSFSDCLTLHSAVILLFYLSSISIFMGTDLLNLFSTLHYYYCRLAAQDLAYFFSVYPS